MLPLAMLAAVAATPIDYRVAENWLCRPGRRDACAGDLAITVVTLDGKMRLASAPAQPPPAADCFYVYPTASLDPTPNSDMVAGVEEQGQAASQFAAFRSVCRTFAPIYRQVTLTALRAGLAAKAASTSDGVKTGLGPAANWDLAYADVLGAWKDYLANDNGGRPFVLIGHSQGSMLLKRLVAEEIDGKLIQMRLLSAILPGVAVLVPKGRDIDGDFKTVPLCRSTSQLGCIVTWSSYRDHPLPPANALFGRSATAGMAAGCTNPARLAGGRAPLDAIMGFPWWVGGVVQYRMPASGWAVDGVAVPTRFARIPGLLSAECVSGDGISYLSVQVNPGSSDSLGVALTDPETVGDAAYPDWGWHVMDITIVQGNLVRVVARQTEAWRARHKS